MKDLIVPTSKNILTNGEQRKLTSQDKIFLHYIEDRKLPAKLIEEKARLEAAFTLLTNYHSTEQAVPMMMKQFDISRATAYRDLKNSIQLFGDITKSSKEGYRHILFEYSMKTFQLAAKNHNYQEMNRAIANMIKLKGLDRDDPDMPDWSKLKQHIYNVILPEDVMEGLSEILGSGAVDLAKLRKPQTIDIDAEEITEEKAS